MIDITGQRFGRLVVVMESTYRGNKSGTWWECVCDCGKEIRVLSVGLREGTTKSCGCLFIDTIGKNLKTTTTHGRTKTPEYRAWKGMRYRCYNKNASNYNLYGGRGITVCKRWRNNFEAFFYDMDLRPEGYSLDRINNNGNYSPNNCRWATGSVQRRNTRSYIKSISKKFFFCNWTTGEVTSSKLNPIIYR